jgi:hypothetical protein
LLSFHRWPTCDTMVGVYGPGQAAKLQDAIQYMARQGRLATITVGLAGLRWHSLLLSVSQTTQEARSFPRWFSFIGCPALGPLATPPGYWTRSRAWSGRAALPRSPMVSLANGGTRCCSWSRRPHRRLAPAHAGFLLLGAPHLCPLAMPPGYWSRLKAGSGRAASPRLPMVSQA